MFYNDSFSLFSSLIVFLSYLTCIWSISIKNIFEVHVILSKKLFLVGWSSRRSIIIWTI